MRRFNIRLACAGAPLVCALLASACDTTPTALRTDLRASAPSGISRDGSTTGTPPATPPAPVASLTLSYVSGALDTTTWTIPAGGTAQYKALAYDSAGTLIPNAVVTYKTNNGQGFPVNSITGLAKVTYTGTAIISATVGSLTASAHAVTLLPPPPLVGGVQIPISLQRFDGKAGLVMVSNGVPLTPGLLTAAALNQVHVVVKGVELRVFVRALSGHFPDSSLRAILLQFDYNIPNATPITSGLLVIGAGPRAMVDLAARAPLQVPAAAALPSDPMYLVASKWAGTLYPANAPAPTPLIAQYEGDYKTLEAADWTRCGAAWACVRTAGYDRPFIAYQEWLRTGNPTYWYHATAEAADYLKNYIIPSQSPTPWWSNSEGVALQYWATGDEVSRYQLRKMAEMMAWQVRVGTTYAMAGTYGDDRMRAKALYAALDAAMLEISTQPSDAGKYYTNNSGGTAYYAQFLTPATLPSWITGVLSTQAPTGGFGGRQYGGGQMNYMVGMLLTGLVRYYEEFTPDPRIPVAVKSAIDYQWNHEWDSDSLGFRYVTFQVTLPDGTVDYPKVYGGLNNLTLPAFAWYARYSADATYSARADTLLLGLTIDRGWWPMSGKAFDQAFYRIFNSFAWRAAAP